MTPGMYLRDLSLSDWAEMSDEMARRECEELAESSRAALARMLRGWEAYTMKKLNLGNVWEHTPLPIEQI
jgi:hypothetical protein